MSAPNINDLEKELKALYAQAAAESAKKLQDFYAKFATLDAINREKVKRGEMTNSEYLEWRKNKFLMGRTYKSAVDVLSRDMVNTDKIAASIINGYTPDAYALGINEATFEIEKGTMMNTSFTLYNRYAVEKLVRDKPDVIPWKPKVDIPKDMRWNKQHINNAITQGILQGESIPKVAKRLQGVAQMNNRQAIRTARTAMTAANNAGRIDSFKRAQSMGIKLRKQWVSTLDHRTRDSHVDMDGEIADMGHNFSNGCEYPADGSGPPEEVYNCRCSCVAVIDKIEQGKIDDLTLRNDRHLGNMTYDEWKQSRKPKVQPPKPSSAGSIGKTGNGYSPDQVAEMGKILQKADKLVQDVWNKFVSMLEAPTPPDKRHGSAYYVHGGFVHLNPSRVASGDALHPPYQTHFHEYGHNIDYLLKSISTNWVSPDGRTFDQIIMDEWHNKFSPAISDLEIAKKLLADQLKPGGMGIDNFISSEIASWRRNSGLKRTDEEYRKVLDEFNSLTTDYQKTMFFLKNYEKFGTVTEFERASFRQVDKQAVKNYINNIYNKYSLSKRGDLSDMMEKFAIQTVNVPYPFGSGHGRKYALVEGNTAVEAFAEMFSAEIANHESLELIKQELPESHAAFRSMLEEALKQ